MKRVIRTGVRVTARNEEKSMAKVLVIGQGLEEPSRLGLEGEDRAETRR